MSVSPTGSAARVVEIVTVDDVLIDVEANSSEEAYEKAKREYDEINNEIALIEEGMRSLNSKVEKLASMVSNCQAMSGFSNTIDIPDRAVREEIGRLLMAIQGIEQQKATQLQHVAEIKAMQQEIYAQIKAVEDARVRA